MSEKMTLQKIMCLAIIALFIIAYAALGETLYCVIGQGEAHDPNTWSPAKVPDLEDLCVIGILNGAKWSTPMIIGGLYVGDVNTSGSASTYMSVAPTILNDCVLNEGIIVSDHTDMMILGDLNFVGFNTFINQRSNLRVAGKIDGEGLIDNHSGKIFCNRIFADVFNGPASGSSGGAIYSYNHIEGDLNLYGGVNFRDLAIFANNWLR